MKNLLKLEELGLGIGGILLLAQTNIPWYLILIFLLMPDISLIGYIANPKWGAWIYNIVHNRLIGLVSIAFGWYLDEQILLIMGLVLLTHVSLDRMLGIGLKYTDDFKHTHLGCMGQSSSN
ncbi:MAG: DUF4260 domain-containing protein [Bacteroidota bacterium]